MGRIYNQDFFKRPAIELAPALVGVLLCRDIDGTVVKRRITETECYMGEEDLACHASKGKTNRTAVLYEEGGICYVYLIYGMYNLLNIVSGKKDHPEAVLIRCCEGLNGPGKLSKFMQIDRSFNRESIITSNRIWLEEDGLKPNIVEKPRVGIDYAGEYWKNIPWRFCFVDEK